MVLSVSVLYTLCYASRTLRCCSRVVRAMHNALNIIILWFDIFQIIYNIDMKYLIDNLYHADTPPGDRVQDHNTHERCLYHHCYHYYHCSMIPQNRIDDIFSSILCLYPAYTIIFIYDKIFKIFWLVLNCLRIFSNLVSERSDECWFNIKVFF